MISLGIIIVLLSGCTLLISSLLPNEYEVLEKNWHIKLPTADEVTDLITTEANFHGDGEWFTLYNYSKPIDFSNTKLIKLTANETSHANQKIEQFKTKTIAIHQESKEITDTFNQHNVEAVIGDYFYYEERNNGYDFIILLYKTEGNQLYKYEWHQ